MALVKAATRIVAECEPRWWVIENVRGAVKWFAPLLGKHRASYGPFFLWGDFPKFHCVVRPFKQRMSSTWKAQRAMVPNDLSESLAVACESCLF